MRENRLYGSEGGAAKAVPTPIDGRCVAAARRQGFCNLEPEPHL